MAQSVQSKEIERLKKQVEKHRKQVEKLKKDKKALQRDKRNLEGRLSTAQTNNAKYRSALKKKEVPAAGLDRDTFERIMDLLDGIITPA